MKASLIISIYKNVQALERILQSLREQSVQDFELILSEDGNDESVAQFVRGYDFIWPMQHLTQEDQGWRKNRALNRAIVAAKTDWLIFIDGDCVLHPKFIEMHVRYKQANVILAGKRVKLNSYLSKQTLQGSLPCMLPYLLNRRGCRYVEEAFYLPIAHWLRRKVRHIVGSNMSMSKEALLSINGFDEQYTLPAVGEDYDIEWRLLAKGYRIVSLRNLAIQYHLYHKENWQDQAINMRYCNDVKSKQEIICKKGINTLS